MCCTLLLKDNSRALVAFAYASLEMKAGQSKPWKAPPGWFQSLGDGSAASRTLSVRMEVTGGQERKW